MGPHEEFLELCAVSTSGDLTEEEKTKLQKHLAGCPECREALKEFQAAASITSPLFAAEASEAPPPKTETWSIDAAEAKLRERLARQIGPTGTQSVEPAAVRAGELPERNGKLRLSEHWNTVWLPFAAAILLAATLGIYAYRAGVRRGGENAPVPQRAIEQASPPLQQQVSDAAHDREVLLAQMAERDKLIAKLRQQVEDQSGEITKLRDTQAVLQSALGTGNDEKQRLAANEAAVKEKLDAAEASLQRTEKELDTLQTDRSRDDAGSKALEAKVGELTQLLRERESTIDQQQELLAHDRDIRELMGARDLYVAEVFDVARNAATQKAYGRVFYTKSKSLIFYGYDLDRHPGFKNASTFQAWGQRGADTTQALNLGVFYEDNVSKKRWVLKFDDAKKLDQIEAVFVTVEPNGGSQKPSGKPFLFAYLKVEPNHP
jgi:predicted  nucleic acid-binding Zn-ribbon protein